MMHDAGCMMQDAGCRMNVGGGGMRDQAQRIVVAGLLACWFWVSGVFGPTGQPYVSPGQRPGWLSQLGLQPWRGGPKFPRDTIRNSGFGTRSPPNSRLPRSAIPSL